MRKMIAFALSAAVMFGLSLFPSGTIAQDKKADKKDEKKEKLKVDIEVVYVPTHEKVVTAMLKLAAVKEGDTVYDLGCGDGRIVIEAVGPFKAKKGLGVDFNPERLADCEAAMKKAIADKKLTEAQSKNLTFKQGDVLKMTPEDFKDVDVVTLYLYPEVNDRLQPVLKKGLKKGARVVSHDFPMTGWEPDKTEKVEADRTHTIHLWTIK